MSLKSGGVWHAPILWRHRSFIRATMTSQCQNDVIGTTFCQKGLSKTFDNSVVAMVTDLLRHWCGSMADSIKSLKISLSMADNVCHAPLNIH